MAGKTTGVLYYDNSYVDGCFDMIEPGDLNRMAQSISRYIERLGCPLAENQGHKPSTDDPDVIAPVL
jgi:hypothetical protein